MGSKFYGKLKSSKDKPNLEIDPVISESEMSELLSAALDIPEPPQEEVIIPTVPETKAEIPAIQKVKKHIAYNAYYDGGTKKFMLVTISYDPTTLQATVDSVEPFADNQAVVLYKLNGLIATKLVRGEESL